MRDDGDGDRAIVVIPTLDEAENIGPLAAELLALPDRLDLLVVDDSSRDGTAERVRAIARETQRVHLLERPRRLGLGTAYRDGFRWALERGYGRLVQMDADHSHRPEDVPRLLEALTRADIAVGSRYLPASRITGWPRRRWLLSRCAALYVAPILGLGVSDPMGGFKAYRAAALSRMGLDAFQATGYLFQAESLFRASRAGCSLEEVAIHFRDRAAGVSKMTGGIILEAALGPFRIRFGR
ncbi:MAG: polyprenol monophosphomannose synthase [bacterium]